ncbi:MAG: response regulator, partial [Bdellovibrionaceae bacterium]|nr:response regulator [Pseudobdellovibrionaceae bacterium]
VEKNIEFEVNVRGPLPSAIISDNNRMRQVILNICGNAIKFTKKGKVTLECFTDTSKIYFRVTDQGCGIPTDQVEKLFKPFAQADSSETREFGGNGLGLALSQKLANSLGGDVVIEKTTENIGSVFLVYFDMGLEELKEIEKKRQQNYPSKSKELDHDVPLKSKKVLVVDDSPDNRLLISYLLKNEEIEVETACDGSEGYERALSQNYDLILLDLQMPVMGGYEAAQRLRESGYKSPIVALTAHAMIGEKENCLNAGFNDYLTKPINKVKLLDVLKYNIENASL